MNLVIAERGVYEQPYTEGAGTRTVFAVDSRGRLVATIAVPADHPEPWKATAKLYDWLDEMDPVEKGRPMLRVIRGERG